MKIQYLAYESRTQMTLRGIASLLLVCVAVLGVHIFWRGFEQAMTQSLIVFAFLCGTGAALRVVFLKSYLLDGYLLAVVAVLLAFALGLRYVTVGPEFSPDAMNQLAKATLLLVAVGGGIVVMFLCAWIPRWWVSRTRT